MKRLLQAVPILCVLALAGFSTGCASATGKMVLVEDQIHDSLEKANTEAHKLCDAPTLEAIKAVCGDVPDLMKKALGAGAAFNRAVAEQKISGLADLAKAVSELLNVIKKLPQGQTAELVKNLAKALGSATDSVEGGQ